MSIIPQDPFLFDDTIEINLDPERLYTTFELYDVLEKCHLIHVVQQLGQFIHVIFLDSTKLKIVWMKITFFK